MKQCSHAHALYILTLTPGLSYVGNGVCVCVCLILHIKFSFGNRVELNSGRQIRKKDLLFFSWGVLKLLFKRLFGFWSIEKSINASCSVKALLLHTAFQHAALIKHHLDRLVSTNSCKRNGPKRKGIDQSLHSFIM